MDVTRRNFRLVADDFDLLLPTCRFISIDEETSGIKWSKETEFSSADTVQQRYLKMRVISTQYKIIQIGVCLFHDNPNEPGAYIARPYNFYVFPGEGVTDHAAQISMEESSLSFNKRHGMDFNKWIYDGIPYVNHEMDKRLEAKLLMSAASNDEKNNEQKESKKDRLAVVLVRADDKEFVAKAISGVDRWFNDDINEREYLLPDCIPSVRRALFDQIEQLYPSLIVENRATEDPWRYVGVVMRLTSDERAARPHRERMERQAEFDAKRGFTRIFRALVDAKKPLVGHNIMYDLLFMMSHFDGTLADDEESFRERFHSFFPLVFDTKYIIQAESFIKSTEPRLTLSSTSLVDVYGAIKAKVDKSDVIPVTLSRGFEAYRDESQVFHEAAFDAYAAGVVFVNVIHGNEQPFLPTPSKQLFGDFSADELKKLGDFCGAGNGWHQLDDTDSHDDTSEPNSDNDDDRQEREWHESKQKQLGSFTVGWNGEQSTNPTIDTAAQLIVDAAMNESKNAATPDPFADEHKPLTANGNGNGSHSRAASARQSHAAATPTPLSNITSAAVLPTAETEWEVCTAIGVGPYPLIDDVTGDEIWLKLSFDVRPVEPFDDIIDTTNRNSHSHSDGTTSAATATAPTSTPTTTTSVHVDGSGNDASLRSAASFRAARARHQSLGRSMAMSGAAAVSIAGGADLHALAAADDNNDGNNGKKSRRGSGDAAVSASPSRRNSGSGAATGATAAMGSLSRRGSELGALVTLSSSSTGSAGVSPRGSMIASNDPSARAFEEQLRAASSARTLTAQGADGFRSSIIATSGTTGTGFTSSSGALGAVSEESTNTTTTRSARNSMSGIAAPSFPTDLPPPPFKSTFPDLPTPRTGGSSTPTTTSVSSSGTHSRSPSAATTTSHSRGPSAAVVGTGGVTPRSRGSSTGAAVIADNKTHVTATDDAHHDGSETDTDDDNDDDTNQLPGDGTAGKSPLLSPKGKKRRPRRPKGFLGNTPMRMPAGQMRPGEVPAPVLTDVPWALPSARRPSTTSGPNSRRPSASAASHAAAHAHDGSHHGGASHAPNGLRAMASSYMRAHRAPLPPPPPPPPPPAPSGNGDDSDDDNNDNKSPAKQSAASSSTTSGSHSRGPSVSVNAPILAASLAELGLPGHEGQDGNRSRTASYVGGVGVGHPGSPVPPAAHAANARASMDLSASAGQPMGEAPSPRTQGGMPPAHPHRAARSTTGSAFNNAAVTATASGNDNKSQPGSRRGSGNEQAVAPAVPVSILTSSSSSPAPQQRVIGTRSTSTTPTSRGAGSRRPSASGSTQVNPNASFYAAIITKAHHVVPPEVAAELKILATTPRAKKAPREGAAAYVGATVLIRNSFGKYLVVKSDGRLEMNNNESGSSESLWKLEAVADSEYTNAVYITNTEMDMHVSASDDRNTVEMSATRDKWETFKIVAKMAFSEEEKERERNRSVSGEPPIFFIRSHHRTNLMQDEGGVVGQSPSEGSGEWSYPEEEWTFVVKVPPTDDDETVHVAAAVAPAPAPAPATVTNHPSHERLQTMSPAELDGVKLEMRIDDTLPNEVKMSLTDLPPLPAAIPEPTDVAETPRTVTRRVDKQESDRVWDAYVATQKEQAAAEEAKAKAAAARSVEADKNAAAAALGFGVAPSPIVTPLSSKSSTSADASSLVEAEVVRARRQQAEKEAIERQKRDSEAGALASSLLAAQAEIDNRQRMELLRQQQRDEKRRQRSARRQQRQREKEDRRVWELNEMNRRNRYLHRTPIDFTTSNMANLLPLARSLYIMNLNPHGEHPLVDDGEVYVLSRFTRAVRTTDLMDAFGNDVRPTIRWIDDYSAFAIIKEVDKAEAAIDVVKRSDLMTIQTLEQFQAQRAAMIMEPLLRLSTAPIGVGFSGVDQQFGYDNRSRSRTLAKAPQYPSYFPGSPLGDKLRHISRSGTAHNLDDTHANTVADVAIDMPSYTNDDGYPLIRSGDVIDEEFKVKPFKIGVWAMLFILLGVGIFAAGVGWTIGKSGRT